MGDNPQQPGYKSSWKQLIISCKNGHKQYFFSCNELCNLNLVKVSHGPSRHAEQTKKKRMLTIHYRPLHANYDSSLHHITNNHAGILKSQKKIYDKRKKNRTKRHTLAWRTNKKY